MSRRGRSRAGPGWAYRAARAVVLTAVAVAIAPVTLVAAVAMTLGWLTGWPPRRLYGAALWCLPMAVAWLAAAGADVRRPAGMFGIERARGFPAGIAAWPWWLRVVTAPYQAWHAMWHLAAHGHIPLAAVTIAPVAVPLGLAMGGRAWARRIYAMDTGAGGRSPDAPVSFDARQWRRQVRTARARIAAPGSVPLLTRRGDVAVGATIRAAGHRARPVAALPYARLRSHQVVIGTTGTGKTTLLLRLWAGFMAEGLRRHAHPMLVVIDCKGGASSRKVADRFRRVMRDAGARSTAIWPDDACLSLWDLPPGRLTTTLLDLIEHGTGGAAYYADVLEAIVSLAVSAPCGPPVDAADFLARLDAIWLTTVYAHRPDAVAMVRSAKDLVSAAALRFRTLWRRLGPGFDGPGGFADADAWYCILEGTAETSVAEAQARALVDMLANYATSADGARGRDVLLAVDEFSAVSRRVAIWQLYERARSLGLAVQVSAQSWEGLAGRDDERYRIAGTAEGGIWLLRTPRPEPVAELAGSRRRVDTARDMVGKPRWNEQGSSRLRATLVLDPDLVRNLDVGQVAYVYRGGVTFMQVKRLVATQAAIGAGELRERPAATASSARAETVPSAAGPRVVPPPDASELLDEAFGPSPAGV